MHKRQNGLILCSFLALVDKIPTLNILREKLPAKDRYNAQK